jgi:hypothetical protein
LRYSSFFDPARSEHEHHRPMPLRRNLIHRLDRPRKGRSLPLCRLPNLLRRTLPRRCFRSCRKLPHDRRSQTLRQNRRKWQPTGARLLWQLRHQPLRHRARHPQSSRPAPRLRQRTRPARTHHPNLGKLSHAVVEKSAKCAASPDWSYESAGLGAIYGSSRRIYCLRCYFKCIESLLST